MTDNLSPTLQAIEAKFKAEWGGYPVLYQNDGQDIPPADQSWVGFEIITSSADLASIGSRGSRINRHAGRVFVHIHVPLGTGDGAALEQAQAAAAIFVGQRVGTPPDNAVFFESSIGPGTSTAFDLSSWWKRTASIRFLCDDKGV